MVMIFLIISIDSYYLSNYNMVMRFPIIVLIRNIRCGYYPSNYSLGSDLPKYTICGYFKSNNWLVGYDLSILNGYDFF